MGLISIHTAFNIDLEFEVAPFHKRLMAYIFDFVIIVVYIWSMKSFLYDGMEIGFNDHQGFDILVISLPMLLYSLVCEIFLNGQTAGKKIIGIRVISLDGGEPSLGQYVLRWITKFYEWPFLFGYVLFSVQAMYAYVLATAILGIGAVISMVVTKNTQRIGDLAAGTVVVNTKSDLTVVDTVFMNIEQENYEVLFPQVMQLTDGDINTIKNVLVQAEKNKNTPLLHRVQYKVMEVLDIRSDLPVIEFLEKLLADYNYLATKDK